MKVVMLINHFKYLMFAFILYLFNTKIIKLDKIYPSDTKLNFIHNYKDAFIYKFNNNELSITRTDETFGWGQDLIGYL